MRAGSTIASLAVVCSMLATGCSDRSTCQAAAEPYLERFEIFKQRTAKVLELRETNEQRKQVAAALEAGDSSSLPRGLEPIFESMQRKGSTYSDAEIEAADESFWKLFDMMFADEPGVLQGEVVLVKRDDSVDVFRYPRGREVPAGLRWHGLRQNRTYCGLADCLVEGGVEPCVLIQLRPRDYGGSAGVTVGFRRER